MRIFKSDVIDLKFNLSSNRFPVNAHSFPNFFCQATIFIDWALLDENSAFFLNIKNFCQKVWLSLFCLAIVINQPKAPSTKKVRNNIFKIFGLNICSKKLCIFISGNDIFHSIRISPDKYENIQKPSIGKNFWSRVFVYCRKTSFLQVVGGNERCIGLILAVKVNLKKIVS